MHRRLVMLGACLVTFAAGAQACPDHARSAVATFAPMSAKAASLVAWKPRAWRPEASLASGQGLRVAIDPETGELGMPSPEQVEALSRIGEAVDERPVAFRRLANGSYQAQLDERWADFSVVTIGEDGKPAWTCLHGSKAAERFLKKPAAPARAAGPAPGVVWEVK